MYNSTQIPSESESTPHNATRYAGCNCKHRQCKDFRDHVGTGPYISGAATPTRGNGSVKEKIETEKTWHKENDAYVRLHKQGYTLPHLNGADQIEKRATSETELKHGKIYPKNVAKVIDKVAKGDI